MMLYHKFIVSMAYSWLADTFLTPLPVTLLTVAKHASFPSCFDMAFSLFRKIHYIAQETD